MSMIDNKPFTAVHRHYVEVMECTNTNEAECKAFIEGADNVNWINLEDAVGQLLIKEKNNIRYEPLHIFDRHYLRVG
jgi:hypothetical protein